MPEGPLLLIDVSGLAYRAVYTTGGLSHGGIGTGVVFGVVRTVMDLMDLFSTDRAAWCFDGGYQKRLEISPVYKRHRVDVPSTGEGQARAEAREAVWEQTRMMYREWLPLAGFGNLFRRKGYEADDVIAAVCRDWGGQKVIVSGDNDLWQLIDGTTCIWRAKGKLVTSRSFVDEWGIDPTMWADVKAIAGCPGDNVIGVRGVGEKTAAKFLAGRLKPESRAYRAIVENNDVWRRNLELVRLPFPGVGRFELREDDSVDWEPLLDRLGMGSIRRDGKYGAKQGKVR